MGYQGGCRSDEYSGAARGWEAGEHTTIYADRVEVRYTDRKTSDTLETVTLARHTASGYDAGDVLLTLAREWGMQVRQVPSTPHQEAHEYIGFYVMRVSLNGVSTATRDLIARGI